MKQTGLFIQRAFGHSDIGEKLSDFVRQFVGHETLPEARNLLKQVAECVHLGSLISSTGYWHEGDYRGPCMAEVLAGFEPPLIKDVGDSDSVLRDLLADCQRHRDAALRANSRSVESCRALFAEISQLLRASYRIAGHHRMFYYNRGAIGSLSVILRRASEGQENDWASLANKLGDLIQDCERGAKACIAQDAEYAAASVRFQEEYVRKAQKERRCLCGDTDQWGGPTGAYCTVHNRRYGQ